MDFSVIENNNKHTSIDKRNSFFRSLLKTVIIILLSPFFMLSWIINQFSKSSAINTINSWDLIEDLENIKIYQLYIDEDNCPLDLDYPEIPSDIYMFMLKTDPANPFFDNKYFYSLREVNIGYYIMQYNSKGHGMTLWFMDKLTSEIVEINVLKSNWWNVQIKENGLLLTASDKNTKYNLEIIENASKP
jgi:hypothetical protein